MKKRYRLIIGLILLSFVTAGIFISIAPDRIPAHYDISGNIDRWGSKYEFIIYPVLTSILGVFLMLVSKYEGKCGRGTNEMVVLSLCLWMLVIFNILWVFLMSKQIDGAKVLLSTKLWEKGILVLMMASLIPVGNIMPRAQRNSIFGLRTKWSMYNDICWQKSQRFGGFLIVGTGILGTALISVLPESAGGYAALVLLVVMVVLSVLGSYGIWKKENK